MAKCIKYLAANLARALEASGTTKSEVAKKVGVSPSYITQLLNGDNEGPNLPRLEAIADCLGTSVDLLFKAPTGIKTIADLAPADHDIDQCWARVKDAFARGKKKS